MDASRRGFLRGLLGAASAAVLTPGAAVLLKPVTQADITLSYSVNAPLRKYASLIAGNIEANAALWQRLAKRPYPKSGYTLLDLSHVGAEA